MHLTPILEQIIQEEVYGNKAIVYHRTPEPDLKDLILADGFAPGEDGSLYGTGMYSTFDLASQMTPYMRRYGKYVCKLSVDITDYLIFVYDIFVKSPLYNKMRLLAKQNEYDFKQSVTEENFILKQLDHFGVERPEMAQDQFSTQGAFFHYLFDYTSEEDLGYLNEKIKKHKIRGFIYEGKKDGNTLVAYDYKTIVPISIEEVPTISKQDLESLEGFSERAKSIKIKEIAGKLAADYVNKFETSSIGPKETLYDIFKKRRELNAAQTKEKIHPVLKVLYAALKENTRNLRIDEDDKKIWFSDPHKEVVISSHFVNVIKNSKRIVGGYTIHSRYVSLTTNIKSFQELGIFFKCNTLYVKHAGLESFNGIDCYELNATRMKGMSEINDLPKDVEHVVIKNSGVRKFNVPSENVPRLKFLDLSENNLSTLEGLPDIETLRFEGNREITSLKGLKAFTYLDLTNLSIKNLDGLDVPFRRLDISKCEEFESLEGMSLQTANLAVDMRTLTTVYKCPNFKNLDSLPVSGLRISIQDCEEFVLTPPPDGLTVSDLYVYHCPKVERNPRKPEWVTGEFMWKS